MSEQPQMENLRDLCIKMRDIQERKEALEAALTELNKAFDDVRMREIPTVMESLGLKNASFAGLGRVQLAADVFASTKEGQRGAAMQWLRDCGYSDLIQETYNASSIKAIFRKMIKEGVNIPDNIFTITPFTRASIVKG